MELSFEELERSFEGVGTFRGGFEVIREEVYEDIEDDSFDDPDDASSDDGEEITDREIKVEIASRILEENLDFGPLNENFDNEGNRDSRMEKRFSLLDPIAAKWVDGEISSVKEAQTILDGCVK